MMTRLVPPALTLAALLLAAGCGNTVGAACTRAKECCAEMSRCEEINRTGPNWESRCVIDEQAQLDKYSTFANAACGAIAEARLALLDCLGAATCEDVTGDRSGHVATCDALARDYCQALRASGDACGHDWGNLGCEGYEASLTTVL